MNDNNLFKRVCMCKIHLLGEVMSSKVFKVRIRVSV